MNVVITVNWDSREITSVVVTEDEDVALSLIESGTSEKDAKMASWKNKCGEWAEYVISKNGTARSLFSGRLKEDESYIREVVPG